MVDDYDCHIVFTSLSLSLSLSHSSIHLCLFRDVFSYPVYRVSTYARFCEPCCHYLSIRSGNSCAGAETLGNPVERYSERMIGFRGLAVRFMCVRLVMNCRWWMAKSAPQPQPAELRNRYIYCPIRVYVPNHYSY